jgi:hypothetical protein
VKAGPIAIEAPFGYLLPARASLFPAQTSTMNKYRFSETERAAIWTADARECFYERTPVRYRDVQIDHIVPESISEAELSKLRPLLPAEFEINSIENWATCHQGCNRRKGKSPFETKTLLFYLDMARRRAPKVRELIREFGRARENDKLLSDMAVRIEQGHLAPAEVLAVVRSASQTPPTPEEPWVIAFGANFYETLPEDAPEHDPELSDWLLSRLNNDLRQTGAIFRLLDNDRSGETVSVRYAFWDFDLDRIREKIDLCWDVLAIQKYSEVFSGAPPSSS